MMNIKLHGILLEALALAIMLLCFSMARAEVLYVVNSQSRTLSRIDTATDAVNNSFAMLGNVPNKVIVEEDYLWVVLSGDNAVQKISRNSGATISNIFIGLGSNPWDAVKDGDYLYVSGLFTNKVYKVDTISGNVVSNVNVGTAPEGLLVLNNKLYVANAGDYLQNYAGSSVSVIDLASFSVVTTLPTPANAQYLSSQGGMLHVSCTGNWVDVGGTICIIDPANDTLIHTVAMGGTPGCLWMMNEALALVGDNAGQVLYSYDPSTYQVLHDSANPIPNGGSEVVGTADFVVVLSPNWGNNGIVKLLNPDLSPWKQYSVAMMPTDLKLHTQPVESSDQVEPPQRMNVYPNPLRSSDKLHFSSSESWQGELCLYNLKGQKVFKQLFSGKELVLPELALPSGVYVYRLQQNGSKAAGITGKIVFQK